jgi:nudix-type nucleoside diphosphatase (YffH/AdpP family)
MSDNIKILSRELVSESHGRLEEIKLRRRRFDANEQELDREIYDIGDSASIFLYDPARQCVLLIRQFRLPVYLKMGRDWAVEVCAGRLQGLDAPTRIVEEVMEETGVHISAPRFLFDAFLSPGSYCEKMSFFAAPYGEADRKSNGGGLAHEGEDIDVFETTLDEALAMIDRGEIIDATTILRLNYAKRTGLMEARG